MANLKQCPNGHYYDPSIHPSCPYCSGVTSGIDRSVSMGFEDVVAQYDFSTVAPGKTMPLSPPDAGPAPDSSFPLADLASGVSYPNHHDGGTVPPEDYSTATVPVVPHHVSSNADEAAPENEPQHYVVGWLVAVEGPYCGKSFEIHHGNTYIGKDEGDIILKLDKHVSRSKHANTIYDDRKNRFLLAAGQSTNLVYVNDELLPSSSSIELKPYDLVELGKSKFRFVPFCSDQFRW